MWDLIFNRSKKNLPNYFSYSQLNSFELCEEQYKLVYIDGIKNKYESLESYMGKRVHSVLEWLYKPENKEEYINFDKICEEYNKEWIENRHSKIFVVNAKYDRQKKKYINKILSDEELRKKEDTFYKIGKDCLSSYYQDNFPFDQPVSGREFEITFTVKEYDKNNEPKFDKNTGICIKDGQIIQEYPFKGIIDRIDKPYEKKWEIHDYKTGKRAKTSKQAQSDFQLALYQIGVEENFKNADKITLIWHSLRHHTTISVSHTPRQLYNIEKKIVKVLKKIKSASVNLNSFKPKQDHQKSMLCYWCPVWNECSAKPNQNPAFQNLLKTTYKK